MKIQLNQSCFNRTTFFIVLLVSFFSTTQLQAQEKTAVESMKTTYQQTINRLDASWDEASYNMPVMSTAYKQARLSSSSGVSNSLGIYSFKGNVKDVPNQRIADQRLKTLALLLRKATDEMTAVYTQQTFNGELKQLKPLLKFLGFTVSNKPLSLRTLDVHRSMLQTMKPNDFEQSTFRAEALTQVAEKLANTAWMASNKHLTYKYLIASLLTIPVFWTYLEPEFSRLVLGGGASTENIVFVKLHMNREPYILQDSRIWNKAPRFEASQLQVMEAGSFAINESRHVTKVELSDTETKVTLRYVVGGREMWYRFDNTFALVDNQTKELYPVKRMENQLPLGKTFIVVGCEGKAVEFTFVFPPLKKTLKQFVLDDNLSAPTSDKAKMRFFKKHNIMSDGSGRSAIVVYNLSEFVTAATPIPSTSSNDRIVKESKPNGRTAEWTYRDDKLVGGKIFFQSGKLEQLFNYVNGVREGESYKYYETGELLNRFRYKNGIQDGITLEYDRSGAVVKEWNFVNGKRNGKTKEYRANGSTAEWIYLSDELVSGIIYYPNGKQEELINYTNGVRDGESFQYYETGELKAKWTWVNGKKTDGIIYYETGETRTLYSFKNGDLDGVIVSYFKSGKVMQKTDVKDGQTHGKNTLYYEDGKLWHEQNFVNGKRQGEELTYDNKGNVTSRKMYVDNVLVE